MDPIAETTGQVSILVVEDEADFRDLLSFEFGRRGFRVFTALDGHEALDTAFSQQVDAVVSDVRMPRMNGLQLLDRIKAHNVARPSVILISAYAGATLEEAYHRGAEAMLTKPFKLKTLLETVQRILMPPHERWKKPPSQTPVDYVHIREESIESARGNGVFAIGRGGAHVVIDTPDPLLEQRIGFTVEFTSAPFKKLAGTGYVRWTRLERSHTRRAALGVEFEYIDDEARERLTQWLTVQNTVPYVPSLFRERTEIRHA